MSNGGAKWFPAPFVPGLPRHRSHAFRSRQRRRVLQGYIPACRIQVEDTDWGVVGDTACGACDTSKRGSRPADLALEARRMVYAPHRGHLISMCVASPLASRRLQCGQRISLISIIDVSHIAPRLPACYVLHARHERNRRRNPCTML